jgi:hypothetical protein
MTYYDHQPSTFEAVGNGSTLYRYNIQEAPAPTMSADDNGDTLQEQPAQWQCDEVVVWAPLTANKVTEAVISARWPSNYEAKLVNEYNAAQLGLYDAAEATDKTAAYKTFLAERQALKQQVDEDCEREGIAVE